VGLLLREEKGGRGEGGEGRGGRREGRGGLFGNVAEEAFCLKSAPGKMEGIRVTEAVTVMPKAEYKFYIFVASSPRLTWL